MKKLLRKLLGRNERHTQPVDAGNSAADTEALEFVDGFLTGLLAREGKLGLLQCGANDGITVDPIRQFLTRNATDVSALLVEPLPDVFDRLCYNYREYENITCINVAIGPPGGLVLYRIKPEYVDLYQGIIATGITSFDREFVRGKSQLLKGIDHVPLDDRIEEFTAQTVTASELIEKHADQIGVCPFIQIDAEGFDDQVIYSIDFDTHKPIGLNYEISKLSDEALTKLRAHLKSYGYRTVNWGRVDELAYFAA